MFKALLLINAASLAIIMSLVLIRLAKQGNRSLAMVCVLFAIMLIEYAGELEQWQQPWLSTLAIFATSLTGPFLLNYVRSQTIVADFSRWHWLAPSISFVLLIPFALLPIQDQLALMVLDEQTELPQQWPILLSLITALIIGQISYAFYLLRCSLQLINYRSLLKTQLSNIDHAKQQWLNLLIGTLIGAWLLSVLRVFLTDQIDINFYSLCLSMLALYLGIYFTITNKQLFLMAQEKYQNSALDSNISQLLGGELQTMMAEKKLYQQPELTLSQLAQSLGVSNHQLSQLLNETFNKSFYQYVNELRVEQAKKLLLSENMAIVDIAQTAGFNSKPSFYKAFKSSTGLTPGEFRKQG